MEMNWVDGWEKKTFNFLPNPPTPPFQTSILAHSAATQILVYFSGMYFEHTEPQSKNISQAVILLHANQCSR